MIPTRLGVLLFVVILLLCGIVVAVRFPRAMDFVNWHAQPRRTIENPSLRELAHVRRALQTFEVDNGRFPTSAEGLDALVHCPEGLEATWQQQLDAVPVDPWGHFFVYSPPVDP